jgi:hypothetical protein
MFKKISLFLIAIISVIALVGCFNLEEVNSIEFVNFPQATYYKVEAADPKLNQAYETLLGEITIRITKKNTDPYTVTLKEAIEAGDVTVNFDASILTKTGTKTMVITLGSAKLTYVFNVVEEQLFADGKGTESDPYLISTPQQFLNIGTRFFGIPVPQSNDETAWKYYYQFSFPYLAGGKYYEITADLDFDGIEFVPLGALGGENYIPFTGTIDGTNKAIKNVTVSPVGDASSIFAGIYGATIKNLNIDNFQCDVNSFTKYAAALSSFVFGDESLIEDVHVTNSQIFAQRAGGILSDGRTFIVKDCSIDENTIIAGALYVGAVAAKSNTTRNFSYYLLTFDKLPVKTVSLDEVENKIFIITGFTSEAKLYSSKDTSMWDGYLYADGLDFENYYIDELKSKSDSTDLVANVEVVSETPDGATTVYLGRISYTSLYTDGSNRVIVLPNKEVYNQWYVGNVKVYYTDETKNNEWNYGTNKAFVGQDGKVYLDNRLFIYDSDGLVGIEIYSLKDGKNEPDGIYNEDGKFELFFKDGVVCGVLTGSTTPPQD